MAVATVVRFIRSVPGADWAKLGNAVSVSGSLCLGNLVNGRFLCGVGRAARGSLGDDLCEVSGDCTWCAYREEGWDGVAYKGIPLGADTEDLIGDGGRCVFEVASLAKERLAILAAAIRPMSMFSPEYFLRGSVCSAGEEGSVGGSSVSEVTDGPLPRRGIANRVLNEGTLKFGGVGDADGLCGGECAMEA